MSNQELYQIDEKANEYFELKNQYDQKRKNQVKKAIFKSIQEGKITKSIVNKEQREKRKQIIQDVEKKLPCMLCKEKGGMNFISTKNQWIAECKNGKCRKLVVDKSIHLSLLESLIDTMEEKEELSAKIIALKNEQILNLKEFDEKYFNDLKNDLNESADRINLLYQVINQVYDKRENDMEVENLEKKILENKILFKKLLQDYKKTNNKTFLRDAMELYMKELHPQTEKLMETKYQLNVVDDGVLIQEPIDYMNYYMSMD